MSADGIVEDPSAWQGALDRPVAPEARISWALGGDSLPVDLWFEYVLPSLNQVGPSCVGQSWANWVEAMVRRYIHAGVIPRGYQMDGEAIWRRGRELFWNGDMNGGLYLPQGFEAAQSLGWIPTTARLRKIGQDWDSLNAALHKTPLVQGHMVHRGWFAADRESGCIDHDQAPDGTGAHATLLIATLLQPDKADKLRRWRALLNSWGAERGRFGIMLLDDQEWFEGAMDDMPYTAEIPDVVNWRGWEKGIVRK